MKKKILLLWIPVVFMTLLFFQNCGTKMQSQEALSGNTESSNLANSGVAKLSNVGAGIYYNYISGYTCTGRDGQVVRSHYDAYSINPGNVCHLGNACNDAISCSDKLPQSFIFAKDKKSFKYKGLTYRLPSMCDVPKCPATTHLPEGENCKEIPPVYDSSGCQKTCGGFSCEPAHCPLYTCGAPPNCHYDGAAPIDSHGCPQGCGNLVCEAPPVCPRYICPAQIPEQALPPGCSYQDAPADSNGCKACSILVCKDPVKKVCPIPMCAAPPENCAYDGKPIKGPDGCNIGCGNLVCKPPPPKVGSGTFYVYKANYTCTTMMGTTIPSHYDAISIQDGHFCHLGNACNDAVGCSPEIPREVKFAADGKSFYYHEMTYKLPPESCPIAMCAISDPIPGAICTVEPAPYDQNGCRVGCGSYKCEQVKPIEKFCPIAMCAAPPPNCTYVEGPMKPDGCREQCHMRCETYYQ